VDQIEVFVNTAPASVNTWTAASNVSPAGEDSHDDRMPMKEDPMPLYVYDWKDGEISLVQAANRDAANMDVLDALGSAETEDIKLVRDLAISLYYDPVVNRVVAALERFDSADRTNDLLRRGLNLPDAYEDVIEYPKPLPDTVPEILDGKSREDDNSE
jgi:hypothetical protein